jgi:predicted DNA-binding transcriptional regulator AlpA
VTSNYGLKPQERPLGQKEKAVAAAPAVVAVPPLLVPAGVAGPMCGRSEASWWRDHAARRVPAPVKLGGRTLWRTQELREWVESGCPDRRTWEALRSNGRK